MKRFGTILVVVILLITSISYPKPTSSQEIPQNPNQTYPIPPSQSREETLPESIPGDSPAYTYPIEGLELPTVPHPDDILEPSEIENDTPLPLPEMVEVIPSEVPIEQQISDPPFSIDIEPAIYIEGKPIILSLALSESEQALISGKELTLELPNGLIPLDEHLLSQLSPEGTLTVSLESFPGSIALNETLPIAEIGFELSFTVSILNNGERIFTKSISIPTQGFPLSNAPTRQTTGITVQILSQDENIANNLLFYAGSLRSQSIPGYSLSLNPIEILAVDPVTGLNVKAFEQPLQLSLGYADGEYTPEEEENLQAFYYNELYKDWFPIETTTDPNANQVHFQTVHLTVFDIKVADWQSYIPPITQSYEVSGFTGSMSYSYPIQTFAGPGGLKPDLVLSYNSQSIDQSIAYTQASWVGMGWTLETGSITRDMHGTDSTTDDDTFFLSYNGISRRLLPISETGDVITYRSQENPTEKVSFDTSSNLWEVRSGDGLIYTFGGLNATAKFKQGAGCALTENDLNLTWQWGLSSVQDRFGNTIIYQYTPQIKGVSDTDDPNVDVYCHNHISLTPDSIHYGNFEIRFITAPRYDYRSSWQHKDSRVLFSRTRLDYVDLFVNGVIVKSYLLRYASDSETDNVIYPNFKWQSNYLTSTLISVQEVQSSTTSPVEGYKPITFSYDVDHMHLDEINNGYGGKVQFTYSPKYQADDINKDLRSARWCFGSDGCPANNQQLTTYCVSDNPNRGWGGHQTLVTCNPSDYEGNLMVYHNGSIPSTAFTPFPEAMIKPGGRYIFYGMAKASSEGYGPNTEFGMTTGVPVSLSTNPITVPTNFMSMPSGSWVYGQDYLVMPSEYNFEDVQLYLKNQGILVKDLQVQQFITRYVVTQRVETDTLTNKSATWTYAYPTEGFKMNIGRGSKPYVKTNLEYRGFSSVTITQKESERQDSLVTIQTFHQDDLLKGRLIREVTKDNTGLCYSQNLYTYEFSELYSQSEILGLTSFTDLNVAWVRTDSVEKQTYNGANCDNLPASDHLGMQEVFTYQTDLDYKTHLNANPLSVTQRVFNGAAWVDEYAAWYEYEPSIEQPIGGKTFFLSGDFKSSRVKTCVSGNCDGALLAETLYSYNSNRTLQFQKTWTKGTETNREYSQISYTYHASGNLASKTEWQSFASATTDPTGTSRTTQYTYDTVFPTQVTQETVTANGTTYTTSTSYDSRFGIPIQVTHPNGAVESAVYDGLGRTIRICAPGDAADYTGCSTGGTFTLNITYELNLTPPRITIARRSMASVRMEYTGFGKLQTRTILSAQINGSSTDWVEKAYVYDGLGRVIEETNGGLATRFLYDSIGRQFANGRASGSAFQAEATYSYTLETLDSQKSWKTSITDAKGNTSSSYANAKGQIIQTVPPAVAGPSVQFVYDLLGRLTQTTYGSTITTITYNAAGLKTQMADPDMGTWSYAYDAQGNLTSQQDATGNTVTLTYDGLNRLTGKTFSDGSPAISYTYDANGDIGYRTGMTDATGSTAWDYDPRGRIIKEEKNILGRLFTTKWAYNSADQMTSMTYPRGELVNITHLPQGGVNSVGAYLTGTQVNTNGRISLRTFGNSTQTSLTYNDWLVNGGRLSMLQSGQSASLLNLGFTYDGVGNILTITDHLNDNQVQTFTYDSMDRLRTASTNATGQGQYTQTYGYNSATGNLNYKSDVGTYTYSTTAQPHAVTQAGTNSYAYDQNGNMTSRTVGGVTWTYTYNAENQLTQVKKNSQLVSEYGYDGDGNRVWAKDYEGYLATNPKVTTYIGNYYEVRVEGYRQPTGGSPSQPCTQAYCAYFPYVANIVAENISYYYADGQCIAMKNNGVVSYLYGDQLGSVSAVADGTGALVSKTLYFPWGTTRYASGTTPTEYAYTGQMQEGEIYFYNSRWYDPELGRFMQADTFVPPTQGTQGFDRYAYVNNNPVNGTDPSGNWLIPGWDDTYILNQGQTNRCAVFSLAMASSAVSEMRVDEAKLEQAWIWRKLGLDWGIPPALQPGGVNKTFPNIEANYLQGDKERIIKFLEQGNPVVVTIAYPKYGHSVVAIGYEPLSDELIFVNPAGGQRSYETELVNEIRHQIEYYHPNTDLSQYENFAALLSHSNSWILSGSLVVLSKQEQSGAPYYVPTSSYHGGNLFGPVRMLK